MGQLPLGTPQHANRILKILGRFDGNTPYQNLMNSGRLLNRPGFRRLWMTAVGRKQPVTKVSIGCVGAMPAKTGSSQANPETPCFLFAVASSPHPALHYGGEELLSAAPCFAFFSPVPPSDYCRWP